MLEHDFDAPAALAICLDLAVPLHAHELKRLPFKVVLRVASECADVIGVLGSAIMFKHKKRGDSATAFNALARGLACLSFSPGGVRFAGQHFENTHPETLTAEDIAELRLSLAAGLSASGLAREFDVPVDYVAEMGGASNGP